MKPFKMSFRLSGDFLIDKISHFVAYARLLRETSLICSPSPRVVRFSFLRSQLVPQKTWGVGEGPPHALTMR